MKRIEIGKKYKVKRLIQKEFNLNSDIVKVLSLANNVLFSSDKGTFQLNFNIFINNIEEINSLGGGYETQVVVPKNEDKDSDTVQIPKEEGEIDADPSNNDDSGTTPGVVDPSDSETQPEDGQEGQGERDEDSPDSSLDSDENPDVVPKEEPVDPPPDEFDFDDPFGPYGGY